MNSIDLELLLEQIKEAVEARRDVLLAVQQGAAPAPAALLLNIKGIRAEFAAILWSEGEAVPTLRQSTPGRFLRGPSSEPLGKKWIGSITPNRASLKLEQSAIANNTDPACLAMAAPSTAIGAGSVVQGTGHAQWRSLQEDDHRRAGAQAAGGALEVCDCWHRHRGRHCEERLKGDRKRLK